jgi:hypothetical protein
MTTPFCGQTRGKATAQKIMNYGHAAAPVHLLEWPDGILSRQA